MRAMGCDFGSVRIGIALSDSSKTLASPWGTVLRSDDELKDHDAIRSLAGEHEVDELIAGVPVSLRGHSSASADAYRAEAARLGERLAIPVICVDERFTTRIAQQQRSHRNRRGREGIDAEAAAVMLQHYLDGR